jgi:hypothetical protein
MYYSGIYDHGPHRFICDALIIYTKNKYLAIKNPGERSNPGAQKKEEHEINNTATYSNTDG